MKRTLCQIFFAFVFALAHFRLRQSPASNSADEECANEERLKKLLQGSDAGATPLSTLPPTKLGFVWTKLYGIEAEGAKFVYVFDRSASMSIARGKPLAAAKRELIASLTPLERVHQFYLIFYNQETRSFQPGAEAGKLIFATDANKTAAERFINGIQPEGATDHYLALSLALKMRPDVIFLLTDGDAKDDLSRRRNLHNSPSKTPRRRKFTSSNSRPICRRGRISKRSPKTTAASSKQSRSKNSPARNEDFATDSHGRN